MSSTNLDEYITLYVTTAMDHLSAAISLATTPPISQSSHDEIYRHIHSLKGSSSVMNVPVVTKLCEDILVLLRDTKKQSEINSNVVSLLHQARVELEQFAKLSDDHTTQ